MLFRAIAQHHAQQTANSKGNIRKKSQDLVGWLMQSSVAADGFLASAAEILASEDKQLQLSTLQLLRHLAHQILTQRWVFRIFCALELIL